MLFSECEVAPIIHNTWYIVLGTFTCQELMQVNAICTAHQTFNEHLPSYPIKKVYLKTIHYMLLMDGNKLLHKVTEE